MAPAVAGLCNRLQYVYGKRQHIEVYDTAAYVCVFVCDFVFTDRVRVVSIHCRNMYAFSDYVIDLTKLFHYLYYLQQFWCNIHFAAFPHVILNGAAFPGVTDRLLARLGNRILSIHTTFSKRFVVMLFVPR